MPHRHAKPLTPAFTRRALRAWLLVLLLAVGAFASVDHFQRRSLRVQAIAEQAELIAALVVDDEGSQWITATRRLRGQVPGIIAVAAIGSLGEIKDIDPSQGAHRTAVQQALTSFGKNGSSGTKPNIDEHSLDSIIGSDPLTRNVTRSIALTLPLPENGEQVSVIATLVTRRNAAKNGTSVLVLLRDSGWTINQFGWTALFAAPLALGGLWSFRSLGRWFEHNVAGPLQKIASAARDPRSLLDHASRLADDGWREIHWVADHLRHLVESLAENNAQTRLLKRDAARRLRVREAGLQHQLRRAKDQLTLDPLTKLRNRAFLEEQLEPLFTPYRTRGGDFTAVILDVDNFKPHNDTYGHQAGDALLRFLGSLLRGTLRPTDHAIRYGGDEFLLLLPDTSASQAKIVAERIVKLFGQYTRKLRSTSNVSLSAGVASLKDHQCTTGHDLIARADAALYAAKRGGKNAVVAQAAGLKASNSAGCQSQ